MKNLKSKISIFLIIFCILFSITCVSAEDNQTEILADDYHSFNELNQSISDSSGELNLEYDYAFGDYDNSIMINKNEEFTINGNDHKIEGMSGEVFLFNSTEKVIINNMTFKNCLNSSIRIYSPVVFNNINFINCSGWDIHDGFDNSFISAEDCNLTFNNCIFQMGSGDYDAVYSAHGGLIINNSIFNSGDFNKGCIYVERSWLTVENTVFTNMSSNIGTAINFKGWNLTIKNSKFMNLHARLSGGAILGKYFPHIIKWESPIEIVPNEPYLMEDCEFINCSSANDGGAIHYDLDSGSLHKIQIFNLKNIAFKDCEAKFGGAISALGGVLNITDVTFEKNRASYYGGAIYSSWSNVTLNNSPISNCSAEKNAGAIYFDMGKLTLLNSDLINNTVTSQSNKTANAIYANDAELYFAGTAFDNGGISVYVNFGGDSKFENVTRNDDIFLLNNTDCIVSIETPGIKLNLTNNSIIADKLPSKFNSSEWGWMSPIKIQGDNDDCWAFATTATLESALLKSTGVSYNLSENYIQKLQLKYYPTGDLRNSLTGFDYSGLGYALSWYGTLETDGQYDDRGMISETDLNVSRIHLQDALIIYGGQNDTIDLIKRAIMKYGSVTVHKFLLLSPSSVNVTEGYIDTMDHGIHFLSLFGWDDNYFDEDLNRTGAWMAKDSLDEVTMASYYDDNLLASDYYAIIPQSAAIAYIFENTIDYHVNYQTDLTGLTGFDDNYTVYSNEFTSKYSELIGAVGTYFNESGINYSFDVYVNGAKVHSQSGVSEFAGFRTIVLNRYIPVKANDTFKVVFKSNALPYQAYSRMHYIQGMSMVSADAKTFEDITLENKTVCLKVYTVADDTKIINNKNIAVDYTGGKYFSVKVVTSDGKAIGAGSVVKFTINGKTTSVKTNSKGIAKIKITQLPKKYTVKTTYNGKTYKNTVTVKQVLTASKITVKKKTAKKLVLKAKLKINGKLVKGKVIKFKFKGKTYKVKTNKKGIAQKILKKNVIKKLKKGKTYYLKIIYLKTFIKTTVKLK